MIAEALPDAVMRAVTIAEERVAATSGLAPRPQTCRTCGSAGRCEGRLPTTDGGWVCRDALAAGLYRVNGQHSASRARQGPDAGE